MIIQNHSVVENIDLGYEMSPLMFPQRKITDSIVSLSQKFNFNIDPSKPVWQLSAGEQQRVEIIKALINGADLLILDEPCQGLDVDNRERVIAMVEHVGDETPTQLIYTTHRFDERPRCMTHELRLAKNGRWDCRRLDSS